MPFSSFKTLVHLWYTTEDIFDEIRELSVPPLTAMQLFVLFF